MVNVLFLGGTQKRLPKDLDGLNQWTSLTLNKPSKRKYVLLNIDEKQRYAGIVKDNWKLIMGQFFPFSKLFYLL